MPDRIQSHKVICKGGLNSNQNWLDLSDNFPGSASLLVNFEPSLFGGYRRINGFAPLEASYATVDAAAATGKIYCVAIFEDTIIVARKQSATATYKFYYWTEGADWTAFATGLTHTSTGVDKIRWQVFNFDGTNKIIFVDGVNKPVVYDGTNWYDIEVGNGGTSTADAGGNQALAAPKYVALFERHLILSGDPTDPNVIAHSAPDSDYDWTVASGAGQISANFEVVQIRPVRESLYVFGVTSIKRVMVGGTSFVIKHVTDDLGCIASDSVQEVNGDLIFLSQDGLRPISATERLNDVELGSISKNIQQDIKSLVASYDLSEVNSVIVRQKSQVRFFFATSSTDTADAPGIIGALKGPSDPWEWGRLLGIRTSCASSGYIGSEEYVLHGDYNGKVYRQEQGNDFDGSNIPATLSLSFLDFGETQVRKNIRTINVFTRPEGAVELNANLRFDWNNTTVFNPAGYLLSYEGGGSIYGEAIYDTDVYTFSGSPVLSSNVEGSGFSVRLTITTNDTSPPYSVQGIVFEYSIDGRS